jgi:hypothetical protein
LNCDFSGFPQIGSISGELELHLWIEIAAAITQLAQASAI